MESKFANYDCEFYMKWLFVLFAWSTRELFTQLQKQIATLFSTPKCTSGVPVPISVVGVILRASYI